jgi:hypothetical protein
MGSDGAAAGGVGGCGRGGVEAHGRGSGVEADTGGSGGVEAGGRGRCGGEDDTGGRSGVGADAGGRGAAGAGVVGLARRWTVGVRGLPARGTASAGTADKGAARGEVRRVGVRLVGAWGWVGAGAWAWPREEVACCVGALGADVGAAVGGACAVVLFPAVLCCGEAADEDEDRGAPSPSRDGVREGVRWTGSPVAMGGVVRSDVASD